VTARLGYGPRFARDPPSEASPQTDEALLAILWERRLPEKPLDDAASRRAKG